MEMSDVMNVAYTTHVLLIGKCIEFFVFFQMVDMFSKVEGMEYDTPCRTNKIDDR